MSRKTIQIHSADRIYKLEHDIHSTCEGPLLDGSPVKPDCVRIAAGTWSMIIDGRSHLLHVSGEHPDYRVNFGHRSVSVQLRDDMDLLLEKLGLNADDLKKETIIKAAIPGLVKKLEVGEGDEIELGQGLLILEAMKMENEINSPAAGRIGGIFVKEGDSVEKNQKLLEII